MRRLHHSRRVAAANPTPPTGPTGFGESLSAIPSFFERDGRKKLFLFLLPLLLALPFLNRAYFVDDYFFVKIADWIKDHPTRPYDFSAEDTGESVRFGKAAPPLSIVNPLLHHYLALLLKVGGEREWFLRLGCVLLSCFAALFIYGLARRLTEHPFLATLLVLVTPAQWLTSYSLLIDSTMGFFFMGGLYVFIVALEKKSQPLMVLSGLLQGLTILAKYTGFLVIPVTILWWCLNRKDGKAFHAALAWGVALVPVVLYSVFTSLLYGQAHILAASAETMHTISWAKTLVFFVFLSGGSIVPLMAWGTFSPKKALWRGLFFFVLAVLFASSLGGFTVVQAVLMALWFSTSVVVLAEFLGERKTWTFPSDPFLLGWVWGFIGMMLMVMQWVAVRYFVIVLPAFVFMIVRIVELKKPTRVRVFLRGGVVFTLLLTALIAYGDDRQAESSRFIVHALRDRGFWDTKRSYFLGAAFTNSYLEKAGWKSYDGKQRLQKGDRLLLNEVTLPLPWFFRRRIPVRTVALLEDSTRFPIKVMDFDGAAGFYASAWGSLPFTLSRGPWERFHLVEVADDLPQ